MSKIPTCPECGCRTFFITVLQSTLVRFGEPDEDGCDHEVLDIEGDMEWDDDSEAECQHCGYQGLLRGMEATP